MTTPIRVIGIGASAGGISALPAVLSTLAADFPAAILVVQHMGTRTPSHLARLLSRDCRLPVRNAVGGEALAAATVYVATPDAHLTVGDGHLVISKGAAVHFSRPSIDVLFQSIASSCGANAVGIILTGTGMDGADGLRAIKRAGGYTIVEDPGTAEYAGMPTAAKATGCVDAALPLAHIGAAMTDLVRLAAMSHGAESAE